MEKDNAQHTEKKFLELVAELKRILHSLKTNPVPHEQQSIFARGYNDGYEDAISSIEYFFKNKLSEQEATQ